MDNKQSYEDQTSVDEVQVDKEKDAAANNMKNDSLSQEPHCFSSLVSQSEKKSHCLSNKRKIPASQSPKKMEEDCLENECLSKRIKIETKKLIKESIGDNSDCSIAQDNTKHTQLLDVTESDLTPSKEHFQVDSPQKSGINEERSPHVEEEQLNCAPYTETNVVDQTISNKNDFNYNVNSNPLASKCGLITQTLENNCSINNECSEALEAPLKQVKIQKREFFCHPCGFKSSEEKHIHAHYSSKSHLRRQSLVAHGWFVRSLGKRNLSNKIVSSIKHKYKKCHSAIKKSKLSTANIEISSVKENTNSIVMETQQSCKTDNESCKNGTTGNLEKNPDSQPGGTEVHNTINATSLKPETSKEFKNISRTVIGIEATSQQSKTPHERSRLIRNKRGFGQISKRLQLMSVNKKDKHQDHFVFIKRNIQPHIKTLRESSGEAFQTIQTFEVEGNQNIYDRTILRTCVYCNHVFQNQKGLEKHVKRRHTKEMQFYCQTCGYSCVTRGDFEKHCQSNRHQTSENNLQCQLCSYVAPDLLIFNTHMSIKHNLSFNCASCKLYFSLKKELHYHEKSEQHLQGQGQKGSISCKDKQAFHNVISCNSTSENVTTTITNTTESSDGEHLSSPRKENKARESHHCEGANPQFQCKKCFYKTRSSTVFTRHIKLRHAQDYHFLCKACNIYSMCKDGMEKHIKRSKHIENARKNNIGLLFEECIEKVCLGGIADPDIADKEMPESLAFPEEPSYSSQETSTLDLVSENAPKRGRPKGTSSRLCTYCGILASSVTNLTVHIRRKHSHQYSYLCKVCNYYTVTKGDMERHCATKKHKAHVADEMNGQQKEIIIASDGTNFEVIAKKKGNPAPSDSGLLNVVSAAKPIDDSHTSVEEQVPHPDNSIYLQTENSMDESQEIVIDEDTNDPQQIEIDSTKCTQCDFVANSVSSLEMHVKRKHSKEFEYYCMACEYYAVTRREMMRHAVTDKHKINHQSYESSSSVRANKAEKLHNESYDIAKEQLQVEPKEYSGTFKQNPDVSIKIVSVVSNFQEKDNVLNATKPTSDHNIIGIEKMSVCREESPDINKEIQPTSLNDRDATKEDNELSNAPSEQVEHTEQSSVLSMATKETPNAQDKNMIIDGKELDLLEKKGNASEHKTTSIDTENEQMERSPIVKSVQPEFIIDEVGIENIHKKDYGNIAKGPSEETLFEVGNEVDACLGEDHSWEIDVSVGDVASESKNSIVSGGSPQNVNQFDSSIVKLKNCQENECTASSVDQISNETEGSNLETNNFVSQPAKRKRTDGSSHFENTRIRCDDCGFLADGQSGLSVHIAMKHPTKEKHFHCLLCGKSFFSENNLHQHLGSVGHLKNERESFEELPEGGATFKCVKCTEPFDSEQSLFFHIKEHHEELVKEVNKYIEEDTEQINREREENKSKVCRFCGKKCKTSNSMAFLAHVRTHTGSKPFKCKICHFAAAQLGDARNHVKRHLGMREYKCHVCGVAFVMKKHLNTHLLGKHGVGTPKERKFGCNLCDRSFRERWALNNHMKLHTGEKPFKCNWPTCHYSFLTASAMKDHYRTHTGEKSFLCDLCGFAGGTRHALTKHRRQHTGEKPFKCDECNFASTTQSHLTRHKRIHTGEKPYMCPWCDYRSNCAENVRKHILHTGKHEGVKMYNCPKCEYATNVPVEFRNHLKEQHLDIENPDLAYLHAGIVSKSFECRLKGQGANFVETNSPFTATTPPEPAPVKEKHVRVSRKQSSPVEQVQQVIIIQGYSEEYDGDFSIGTSVEETAAATLQTLAMAGQVARVVHITEDGQVIATDQAAHMDGIIPGNILSDQLPEGATQVVVVEGPVEETDVAESVSIETVTDSSGNVVQQVMSQGILDASQNVHAADSSSALDALLCAVTELGNVEDVNTQQNRAERTIEDSLVKMSSNQECSDSNTQQIQMYHEIQEGPQGIEPMEVVRQVMHSSSILSSQESTQMAFKKMVQGVLQFAVCDSSAADQLMQDGVTQVIVNDEGTVHMVSREGPRIIMHNTESHTIGVPEQHMDLVESDGEISQIIVTEELARAMVQNASGSFEDGTTHYIVTELPQGDIQKEPGIYTHTVIETDESDGFLHAKTIMEAEITGDDTTQELTNMVVYTECSPQGSQKD
ncbi:zinc finger protein 407 [Rhinophrynus dorsalis]